MLVRLGSLMICVLNALQIWPLVLKLILILSKCPGLKPTLHVRQTTSGKEPTKTCVLLISTMGDLPGEISFKSAINAL